MNDLTVLSYNIHKGFGPGNRAFVLEGVRQAIRQVHADLVFLQEVQGIHLGHQKKIAAWPEEPQFEYLADEIWPHHAYGKNAVYSSGHHGNAILSKHPIRFWENIDISTNRLESRGLLHAVIEHTRTGKPLHAICVHLGLREADRKAQIQLLCERIESHVPHREPLVIAGDFNDWRGRASRMLEQKLETREAYLVLQGHHARTFPSWLPALQLDRIYFRGLEARSARTLTGRPWIQLSDHLALYAELRWD